MLTCLPVALRPLAAGYARTFCPTQRRVLAVASAGPRSFPESP
jgi:hypothetical protein